MIYIQLGGVIEPNREQCNLNARGEYSESVKEVRVITDGADALKAVGEIVQIVVIN